MVEDSETVTKLLSTYSSTEFGIPRPSTTPPKYAWLGANGPGLSSRGGDDRPTAGLMRLPDRHGGDGKYETRYWVCPIPPLGRVVLECEWLAASLERTQVEIDAKIIRDASARAKVIFPREQLPSDDA